MKIQKLVSSLLSGNLLYNRKDRFPHKAGMHLQLSTHALCLPTCLDKLPKCLSKTPSLDPISSCLIEDISPAAVPPFQNFQAFPLLDHSHQHTSLWTVFLLFFDLTPSPGSCPHFSLFSFTEKLFERAFCTHSFYPIFSDQTFVPTTALELLLSRSPVTHISPNLLALTFPS